MKVKKQISCQGKTDNGNETKTDPNCPAFSPPLPLRLAALKAPLTDVTENCSTKCSAGMKRPPNGPVCPQISVWENYICIRAYVYDGCSRGNAGLLWAKLASIFVPLAWWARFTEITFPVSAEGERNLSPGVKGEKIEGHYNVITSYPADPDVPEIEYWFLEDMKGRRRAAYRGRREHVNREKRENIST